MEHDGSLYGSRASRIIARKLANALPSPKRRQRKQERRERQAPDQRPVVPGTAPSDGAHASMVYAIDRIDQLLDEWTERDPSTLAGAYYLDLQNLQESLSNMVGE